MILRLHPFLRFLLLPLTVALVLGSGPALHAVSVSTFHAFTVDEPFDEGGVVQTADGSLYTLISDPVATLLRFAPDGTLTSFPVAGITEEAISGPLLLASDGNFYGVILGGSPPSSPQGSLYRLAPNGVLTLLHVFTGGNDGTNPQPGLVQGPDGALYGATTYVPDGSGIPSGEAGTVFRCTLDGALTTLHRFPGGVNAPIPTAPLTVGHDGKLYGLASSVLFSVTPAGDYTVLHEFTTNGYSDEPNPGFVQDAAGFFYGTTRTGGSENTSYPFAGGTVFRFTPDGQVTTLHRFDRQEGELPTGPLSIGPNGNFYGVLSNGGDDITVDFEEGGALFRVTPPGEVAVVYHDHTDTGLRYAPAGLTAALDGSLYVFTPSGLLRVQLVGAGSVGFTNDTFRVESSDGFAYVNFYRTDDSRGEVSVNYATADDTAHAGVDYTASSGTVRWGDGDVGIKTERIVLPAVPPTQFATSKQFTVQLSQPGGGATLLPVTTGTVVVGNSTYAPPGVGASSLFAFSGGVDGATIRALFPAADGSLVGATVGSGPNGDHSTVFRLGADGSLHLLADTAFLENAALVQGRDGNFYGTRFLPGQADPTLCRLSPDGTLTTVADLGPSESEEVDGPYRTLFQAHDGSFYGAVEVGTYDTKHHIRIFRVATDGTQATLHTLAGNDPVYLVEGLDGLLYGIRYSDAAHPGGFVFSISPTGDYHLVHDFASDGATGPGRPATPLFLAANGSFYGLVLPRPDNSGFPAFYKLKPNGKLKVQHLFTNREGIPNTDFVAGGDGSFYGTLNSNTVAEGTILYRLSRAGELSHVFYTGQTSRNLQLLAHRSDGTAFLTDDYNSGRDLYRLAATDQGTPSLEMHLQGGASAGNGTKAKAVVTRTGNLETPLTLVYKVSGTARPGVDYQTLSGTVTIPAGRADGRITIHSDSLPFNAPTQDRTLKIALTPATDDSYRLTPGSATVDFVVVGAPDP